MVFANKKRSLYPKSNIKKQRLFLEDEFYSIPILQCLRLNFFGKYCHLRICF